MSEKKVQLHHNRFEGLYSLLLQLQLRAQTAVFLLTEETRASKV